MFKTPHINPPGDWMLSSAIASIDELSNLSDTTEVGMHKRKILYNIIMGFALYNNNEVPIIIYV
jgi:hypothetical protein